MALLEADDYGTIANKVGWTLCSITTLIVLLRFICRAAFSRGLLGRLGPDDYITAVCVIILIVSCILMSIGATYGLGRHQASLDPADVVIAVKWNAIINCILIWSFSLPKFAIIAILKRILDYGRKTTIVFWGLALTSQACFLATSVWWFAQCRPIAYQWDRTIEGGSCASVNVILVLGYFTSAYSAFLDLFFALYPIPFIMRLNMPLKSRIAVSVAMGLSSLGFVVSVYKLAIFNTVFELLEADLTYPVPYLDIWGIAEGAILIICASLPTLGPLFRLARGKLTSYGTNRSAQNPTGDRSQPRTGTGSNWSNIRGHKLEDPDLENASAGMHSSIDDIPLVTTTIRVSSYRADAKDDGSTGTSASPYHEDLHHKGDAVTVKGSEAESY